MSPELPTISVHVAEHAQAADLERPLRHAGFPVHLRALHDPLATGECRDLGLVLIDGSHAPDPALEFSHRLRSGQGEHYLPILFVSGDAAPAARLASLECGADTYLLRPFDPAELLAQVHALLRIKGHQDKLRERTAELQSLHKSLQAAYQQIDMELDLARRIQESFLPQQLPQVAQVRFAVKYRPCGRVGGDFYDVFRLDEDHLGFYVADAMGHGVPASLLTVFVKTSVRTKEIVGKQYRLLPPEEVLRNLNRELIAQRLSDTPFITMVYGLFDFRRGVLTFARSGHPYPLHIPGHGPVQAWTIEGSLLGVFDTVYRSQTRELQPGDKVLLHTDGMDAAGFGSHPVGKASLLAAAETYRHLPVDELVERLGTELFQQTRQSDDLTLLGLEVVDPAA